MLTCDATCEVVESTVAAAKTGSEEAWACLFDLYYERIEHFFLGRVGNHEDAEDMAAVTFSQAYRSIGRFRWQGKPFQAWLFGIAHHQLASYYRSRRSPMPLVSREGHARAMNLAPSRSATS